MGYWIGPGTILPEAKNVIAFSWQQDPVKNWSMEVDSSISGDLLRKVLDDVGALGNTHTTDYTMWGEGQAWVVHDDVTDNGEAVLCISYLDHRPWHGPVARRHEVVSLLDGHVVAHHLYRERIAQFDEEEILIIQVLGAVVCLVIPPWCIVTAITLARLALARDRVASGLCQKCSYPTAGLKGTTCPECGTLLPLQLPAPAQD